MPLKFNRNKCVGCRLCQLACSAKHEGAFNPSLARLTITTNYELNLEVVSFICSLCLKCVQVCGTEAITYNSKHLVFEKESCTNCGLCVEVCPENVISERQQGVAVCNLCEGSPECVAWCPHQALTLEVTT